jgi:hypothetical protein
MGFEKPTSKCAASFLAKPFSHALQDHRHCDSPEINWVPQKPVPGKKKIRHANGGDMAVCQNLVPL